MAADEVAAEPITHAQGLLQVDRAGPVQADGPLEALVGHLDIETPGMQRDDGHAGALQGNRIADGDIIQIESAGIDLQTDPGPFMDRCIGRHIGQRSDGDDAADGRDDTCEHDSYSVAGPSARWPIASGVTTRARRRRSVPSSSVSIQSSTWRESRSGTSARSNIGWPPPSRQGAR